MKWPKHLAQVYHDLTPVHPLPFPFKHGTYGCPTPRKVLVTQRLSHFLLQYFALDTSDRVEMQRTYLQLLDSVAGRNYAVLRDLCTPELALRLLEDLERLHNNGYRVQLKYQWDGVTELKLYGFTKNYGLSPSVEHNCRREMYTADVIFIGPYPWKFEYSLLNSSDNPIEAIVESPHDPFSLAGLSRDSPRLHKLIRHFPLEVRELDVGFLSQRKFHIADIYSKKKVVSGEMDLEEYEFHMLKLVKASPAEQERYEREADYRRFLDVNFSKYLHRWLISDIDQTYAHTLFPPST